MTENRNYPTYEEARDFAASAPVELTPEEEANLPKPIEIMSVGNEPYYDRLLRGNLRDWGIIVTTISENEIDSFLETEKPDIIIMSEDAPIRLFDIPDTGKIVVMGDGRNTRENRIKFLDFGADQVVEKRDYAGDGCAAQIRAIHRRYEDRRLHPAKSPDISPEINEMRQTVAISGKKARLGKREFKLFNTMFSNYGSVMSYDELCSKAFGPEYRGDMTFLRVYYSRMNTQLRKAGILDDFNIATQETMGYAMGVKFKEIEVDETLGLEEDKELDLSD